MPYIAPPFTPSVTISGTDLIRNTDEKLQTIANDVGDYLEVQSQAMYTDLDAQMTVIEGDYYTVLKPEIEQKMDDLLTVNPDGTYYTKSAIDTLVASKVAKVTSTDNAIARFNGTTGNIQNSSVVIDDNGGISATSRITSTNASDASITSTRIGGTSIKMEGGSLAGYIQTTTNNPIVFSPNNTERMRIDSSGNVGIGVTPSAWGGAFKTIDINSGAIISDGVGVHMVHNSYFDAQWKFKGTGYAQSHYQSAGNYVWRTSTTSGTSGNPITWTTALTIPTTGGIQLPNTAIANATTLDWYEEATVTLTATGMTTTPTGVARFTRNGDTVTINTPFISGTSNATTFTLTGIPTSFRPTSNRIILLRVQDNSGSLLLGMGVIDLSGNITISKDVGGTAFTASGVKAIYNLQATYHI